MYFLAELLVTALLADLETRAGLSKVTTTPIRTPSVIRQANYWVWSF